MAQMQDRNLGMDDPLHDPGDLLGALVFRMYPGFIHHINDPREVFDYIWRRTKDRALFRVVTVEVSTWSSRLRCELICWRPGPGGHLGWLTTEMMTGGTDRVPRQHRRQEPERLELQQKELANDFEIYSITDKAMGPRLLMYRNGERVRDQ